MGLNKLIVTSVYPTEVITQVVKNNRQRLEIETEILYICDLLNKYTITDLVDDDKTSIKWTKNNGEVISNNTHLLLNRVVHIPDALFNNFQKNDKDYAKREFTAYLGFSFNAFKGVGNMTSCGTCAPVLSLPQQWSVLSNKYKIPVPRYYLGPDKLNTLTKNKVYSDIFNYYNWSTRSKYENSKHVFSFEKPNGVPVFVFNIGDESMIMTKCSLPEKIKELVVCYSKIVNRETKYFISETLFFVDSNKIIFGCVNNDIIQSAKHQGFTKFILDNLIKEYFKCLS